MRKVLFGSVMSFGLLGASIAHAETPILNSAGIIVGTITSLGQDLNGDEMWQITNQTVSEFSIFMEYQTGSITKLVPVNGVIFANQGTIVDLTAALSSGAPDFNIIGLKTEIIIPEKNVMPNFEYKLEDGYSTFEEEIIRASQAFDAVQQNDISDNSDAITNNKIEIENNSNIIFDNSNIIFDNSDVITENKTAIESNDSDIESNHSDITVNKTAIEGNDSDISDNSDAITDNKTAIEGNDSDIADNKTAIESNDTDISDNSDAIEGNDTDISDLEILLTTTSNSLDTSNDMIEQNTQGIASNSVKIGNNAQAIADAMAFGMVQQDVNYEGLQLSIGSASYDGYSGFAIVGGAKVSNDVFINFGATASGNFAGSANFKF